MSNGRILPAGRAKVKNNSIRRDEWKEIVSRISEFTKYPLKRCVAKFRSLGFTDAEISEILDQHPSTISRDYPKEAHA